jgi:hypothetical protein
MICKEESKDAVFILAKSSFGRIKQRFRDLTMLDWARPLTIH